MQRWALLLSAHDYTIEYRKGPLHANADGLSRLPLPLVYHETPGAVEVFYMAQLDTLPVSNSEIRRNTKSDPILFRVLKMVSTGCFRLKKILRRSCHPICSVVMNLQYKIVSCGV